MVIATSLVCPQDCGLVEGSVKQVKPIILVPYLAADNHAFVPSGLGHRNSFCLRLQLEARGSVLGKLKSVETPRNHEVC